MVKGWGLLKDYQSQTGYHCLFRKPYISFVFILKLEKSFSILSLTIMKFNFHVKRITRSLNIFVT